MEQVQVDVCGVEFKGDVSEVKRCCYLEIPIPSLADLFC